MSAETYRAVDSNGVQISKPEFKTYGTMAWLAKVYGGSIEQLVDGRWVPVSRQNGGPDGGH